MSSTNTVETKVDTPFTSGALRSGSSVAFWKSYIESRPSPSESFFQLIDRYHKAHGDPCNKIAHDVGTGPGNIAARLAAYFDQVVGSDLNEHALATAPALQPAELQSRLHFVHSRAEELPEKVSADVGGKGTTDLITVSECIPLLDTTKALGSFHTLLRPGGTLGIYFYGSPIFTDGDAEKCNAAYGKLATRICQFNQPMKGTPGFPFHFRAAEMLESYLDNIVLPSEDWESVERHKWNSDHPLLFNDKAGFDFDFGYVDKRGEGETTKETIDHQFWSADWGIDKVSAYIDSVYPNWRDKAGAQVSEVEELLAQLEEAMGKQARRVTFTVVLILATKKGATTLRQYDSPASRTVALTTQRPGLGRVLDSSPESIEKTNELLQKNHDENHVFWRDLNGHNHMAHSLLTTYAMGGTPSELKRAYADGIEVQRPMPPLNKDVVQELSDDEKLLAVLEDPDHYTSVLVFFEQQMDLHGWQAVLEKYCFARTKLADAILARMYEGAYHPIIHWGLGVEFEQPSIIAEGLGQAVCHPFSGIPLCLQESDGIALQTPNLPERALLDLFAEARANDLIYRGPQWTDFANKMKDGVLGRAKDPITHLASQFRVTAETLDRRAAEVIACTAYLAGAAQRPSKIAKIDFFYMHAVTSSIFLTVLLQEPWISIQDKIRLVEWKGRTDLLWYVASGCAPLDETEITQYKPTHSAGMDWPQMYHAVNVMHDDGHVGKFIRAVKSAEEVCRPFEAQGVSLPMHGDMWMKLAHMTYDSTLGLDDVAKWVWGVGFTQAWGNVPNRA